MNILIMLLLLCVVAFFVGYPLIKPEYDSEEQNLAREKLKAEKDAVMTTLNEIEFDYQMGKLAEDDYEMMKNKYQVTALEILKEEDDRKIKNNKGKNSGKELTSIDDEIERELQQMRAKKADRK